MSLITEVFKIDTKTTANPENKYDQFKPVERAELVMPKVAPELKTRKDHSCTPLPPSLADPENSTAPVRGVRARVWVSI